MFRIAAVLLLLGTGLFFAGLSMLVPAFVEPMVRKESWTLAGVLAAQPLGTLLVVLGVITWGVIVWVLRRAQRQDGR